MFCKVKNTAALQLPLGKTYSYMETGGKFMEKNKKIHRNIREKKPTTFLLAVLPIAAMILLLGIGYAVLGLSAEVLMLVSAAVAAVIAVYLGYTWDEIMNSIVNRRKPCLPFLY